MYRLGLYIYIERERERERERAEKMYIVDPGGPAVIILDTGTEVHRFKPGRGRWVFSWRIGLNAEDDFLRKKSKAVGPGRRFMARKRTLSRN